MPWSTTTIAGRSAEVFEPRQAGDPASPGPVVLFLHDHDHVPLASSSVWTDEFERHGIRCVCPEGARSWWLDRVCGEFDESTTPLGYLVGDVLPWMAERWRVEPPFVGLAGFGMGGQGVLQLAFRRARTFPVVAAISPCVDFHELHGRGLPLDAMFPDREAARQETAILHVHPLDWPRHMLLTCDRADEWYESLDRLAGKLYSSGIPFEEETSLSAGGHTTEYLDAVGPRAIAFLVDRLAKERRRVP